MNLLIAALLMLCGLGTPVLATTIVRKIDVLVSLAAFGGVALVLGTEQLPDPAWTGGFVALIAALRIFRPRVSLLAPACAGALAAVWSALLQTLGLPLVTTLPVAGGILVAAAFLARRPAFASEGLREESFLFISALGLAVAVIPGISEGWHSAVVLNREETNASRITADWVFVLSGVSLALGAVYSLLRRQ